MESSKLKRLKELYGEEEGLQRWEEWKISMSGKNPKKAQTIENFIIRYGEELGQKKWNEYLEKLKKRPKAKNPRSKKDWKPIDLIKNYDKKESINLENITDEFLEKFQEKWNELRKENPKMDAVQLYSKTIKSLFTAKSQIKKEYWIQRFWSEEDAAEKTNSKREIQIANEDWYVKKYGEEKGKKLWKEKCQSSNLLENWSDKFGKEKAQEMFDEYREKLKFAKTFEGWFEKYGGTLLEYQEFVREYTNQNISISKISQELFNNIILENEEFSKSHYGENEQLIPVPLELKKGGVRSNFFPDFLYRNKIIEFYGDYWHRHPSKFDDNNENRKIWEYDKIRVEILTELGYEVKIVWESDYIGNEENIIRECINFLTD